MPKITELRLHLSKLFRENYWLFFPDTVYYIIIGSYIAIYADVTLILADDLYGMASY